MQGADLGSIRFFGDPSEDEVDTKGTIAKLNQIIIPEVNFENVTVEEALAFIEKRTKELDSTTLNGAGQGLKIQVKTPKVSGGELHENDKDFGDANDPNSTKIKSLNLKNVPARVALQYIADAAKLRYRVDGDGVTLLPLNTSADADIVQRRWKVSPEVAKDIQEATANGKSFETVLKENGVSFMANSGAHFLADENTLIIRNSPTNLKLVEVIMGAAENAKAEESKKLEADWLIGEDSLEGELPSEGVAMEASNDGERSINAKGNQIIIPEVRFENTTVAEALKFVRLRSIEFDNTTLDDDKKGVNIVVADPEILKRVLPDMDLDQVPLKVLLDKIGEATGTTVEVGLFACRLAKGETSEVFDRWEKNDSNQQTTEKMNQIILPEMVLRNSSMAEALEFLRLRSNELDTTTLDYEGKGIGIVIDDPKLEKKILEGRQIVELDLKNVPLRIAIQEIARQVGCKVRLEEGKLIFFSDPAKKIDKLPEGFETSTAEKSDSTFSLNVSDVSFKLAKSALAGGSWPDASKVRPEEFVNAFDYDDTKPTQSEKVACEIEQGSHPFMQQRNLMRIAMSTASLGRNAATPLRLTILLDQSGSMERADRAESVQRAFALLAAQMNPNDEVTLVGFARTPRLLAERVKGNEMAKLAKIIANPLTEGGTNLEEALSSGLQLAKQQFLKGAQNRIILLTDGAANLGDALPENLARQVESMRRANIAFDACGVGADGLNDDVLSSLAKQGDGRYYFLDRPEDADEGFARQIAGALRPAAKNVKVQILFNPERVSTFKLYGYEKHKLKKEDFRNDSVDAAEMAAEESGVALYHFEPLPEGRGDIGTVSVRFLDTASNEMVERTWAIPYLPDVPLFSEAEPTVRLASVAGLFAEKLKASPVGDRVDLKRLRQEAQLLKPTFQNQARFDELQTMLQQAGD